MAKRVKCKFPEGVLFCVLSSEFCEFAWMGKGFSFENLEGKEWLEFLMIRRQVSAAIDVP
ncbi:hypothetical protein OROHE_001065 [Orobanche hederae]